MFINHSFIIIYGDENSATFPQANDDSLTWLKWTALNLTSDSWGPIPLSAADSVNNAVMIICILSSWSNREWPYFCTFYCNHSFVNHSLFQFVGVVSNIGESLDIDLIVDIVSRRSESARPTSKVSDAPLNSFIYATNTFMYK